MDGNNIFPPHVPGVNGGFDHQRNRDDTRQNGSTGYDHRSDTRPSEQSIGYGHQNNTQQNGNTGYGQQDHTWQNGNAGHSLEHDLTNMRLDYSVDNHSSQGAHVASSGYVNYHHPEYTPSGGHPNYAVYTIPASSLNGAPGVAMEQLQLQVDNYNTMHNEISKSLVLVTNAYRETETARERLHGENMMQALHLRKNEREIEGLKEHIRDLQEMNRVSFLTSSSAYTNLVS